MSLWQTPARASPCTKRSTCPYVLELHSHQILGLVLNMSHFLAPDTGTAYPIFGSAEKFDALANRLHMPVLGRVPLEMHVSQGGDAGVPEVIRPRGASEVPDPSRSSQGVFLDMARRTWKELELKHT